jgi:ABC-type nitrate/sulfonate/bicarbonate transport system permease component
LIRHELLPDFVTGVRLAVSYAIILVAVLESCSYGSGEPGIGHMIMQSTNNTLTVENQARILVALMLCGGFGAMLNRCLELFSQWLVGWQDDS